MKKSESVVWLVTRTGSFADVLAFAIVALLLVVFTLCKINLTRTPKKEDSLRPAEAASPCDEHNKSVLELLNEVQKDIELMSSSLIQSANWLNEKDCVFPKCAFLQLHNSMCMKNFRVGRLLGKGSFGEVVMVSFKGPARKLNARSFAMKYLRCDKRKRHKNGFRMAQERNILIRLQDHPFIIRLVTSFEEHGIIHLITDYYAGGDLKFQLLLCGTFGEEVCKFYGAEILLALEHLHSKGILLRDLKPANILLDGKGHIRLADFGLAKAGIFRSAAGSTTRAGSPAYMAPECRAGKEHGLASDWWSYGATLYDMLVGHPPRQGAGHCCRKGGSGGGGAALELPRALSPTARQYWQGKFNPHLLPEAKNSIISIKLQQESRHLCGKTLIYSCLGPLSIMKTGKKVMGGFQREEISTQATPNPQAAERAGPASPSSGAVAMEDAHFHGPVQVMVWSQLLHQQGWKLPRG